MSTNVFSKQKRCWVIICEMRKPFHDAGDPRFEEKTFWLNLSMVNWDGEGGRNLTNQKIRNCFWFFIILHQRRSSVHWEGCRKMTQRGRCKKLPSFILWLNGSAKNLKCFSFLRLRLTFCCLSLTIWWVTVGRPSRCSPKKWQLAPAVAFLLERPPAAPGGGGNKEKIKWKECQFEFTHRDKSSWNGPCKHLQHLPLWGGQLVGPPQHV